MLHTGQGDPRAAADRLLEADPHFVPAHCLRVALGVMAARDEALPALAQALRAARALPPGLASQRERRHFAAGEAWLARDLKRSLALYGGIVRDHPHDTLALRVAHFGDLQWSRTADLRDRVAAVLPHWHPGRPGYGHVLGMYAFGLAEMGDLALAHEVGRRALQIDADHAGAVHAIAHAYEYEGRSAEGAAWLRRQADAWTGSVGYAVHLWWHLALCHVEQGDADAALQIYDRHLRPSEDGGAAALIDASALLWRLQLEGVDVSGRWPALADRWSALPPSGLRPFEDTHAILAFAGARRMSSARHRIDALGAATVRARDLERAIVTAALPVAQALARFGAGDFGAAATLLERHRQLARRCGGSRAQCDLLHLTLLEAALRSGRIELSRELVAERMSVRPRSRLNHRLVGRLQRMARPAMSAGVAVPPPRADARANLADAG
jgi:tetratricopeptide (TPR) repeat protein